MDLVFTDRGWKDYLYWQRTDKKKLKRINELIKEIQRAPFEGTGKPEPLRWDLRECWSRRIDQEHRLVYRVRKDGVVIVGCRYHY